MSQIYFFMSPADAQEFLEYLEGIRASANEEQIYPFEFEGRNDVYRSLNYLPCRRYSQAILFGRVATPKSQDQSESVWKSLRSLYGRISRWIKKHYSDNLLYKNHRGEIVENKTVYWLGPKLKRLLKTSDLQLKGSTNSTHEWIPAEDFAE